jgi:hypothetical protein
LGIVRSQEKLFLTRSSVTQAPGLLPDFQAEAASLVQERAKGEMALKSPDTGAM